MSRTTIACLVGLLGFLVYLVAAVATADAVLGTHWLLELGYFLVAGFLWVVPARWLIFWVAAAR